jgi:hypothetical protein
VAGCLDFFAIINPSAWMKLLREGGFAKPW